MSTTASTNDTETADSSLQFSIRGRRLADFLTVVGALVEECKIHVDDDGLGVRAVDPANVAMVDVDLGADAFESYHRGTVELIGLNLNRVREVVGTFDSDTEIQVEMTEDRRLQFSGDGLEFNLALIDPATIREEPDIPELDLPGQATLQTKMLKRANDAASMVSDHITISMSEDPDNVIFSAEGDTDDVTVSQDESEVESLDASADAESMFSLDYVGDMVKALPTSGQATFDLGDEMPIKLRSSKVFDSEDDDESAPRFDVEFMIAPRIQSN